MTPPDAATLAVLGAGSWGSTMAALLAGNGHAVRLWSHAAGELELLRSRRHPPGVPELVLPDVVLTSDLNTALDGADAAMLVLPAQAIGSVAARLAPVYTPGMPLVIASKGIDLARRRLLSDVVVEAIPGAVVAVLSGPCIAREVARGLPTSVVAACTDAPTGARLQRWFATPTFRAYRQDDVVGVEIGGAYKNVVAIAAGVGDGMGFGANSKSALLTRGLAEMRRFALAFGASDLTMMGLAGLGDLTVTCFSPHSRNRRFGEALAGGATTEAILAEIGETVEGVATARAILALALEHGLETPVADAVVRLVDGEWTPRVAVQRLMTRELKDEF